MEKTSHPSVSKEQQEAEKELVEDIARKLKISLARQWRPLAELSSVTVDGYCDEPATMCEAWAHLGSPKGAQPSKVMMDALKMLFIEKRKGRKFKKILVFANEEARKPFYQDSDRWQAKCLQAFDIECKVGQLQPQTLKRLREAQERQGVFQKGTID